MNRFVQDIRFGVRLLARQRGFTAVALLVLAVGIGANTAAFGLVNALLLKPRPGHTDGMLVGVYSKDVSRPDSYRAFSYLDYADLRAHTDVFASLTAHNLALVGWTEGETTRRVLVDMASANFFDTFGVTPILGRNFRADEERPGADVPVAILSYTDWQRMGGDTSILGRTVTLNGRAFTIVGIAPKWFAGSLALLSPAMWVPLGVYDHLANDFMKDGLTTSLADRRHYNLIVVARLQPGATVASIGPALDTMTRQMAAAAPADDRNQALVAAPLARLSISTAPTTDTQLTAVTVVLLSLSGIVLLIASLNLANMVLARGAARRKEFAVRLAIGASRGRIVRQLLTEGFVLSAAGGVGGLLLASWGTRALVSALGPFVPLSITFDATPDIRIFAATFACCSLSTIVFGLGPAWKLARTDTVPELKDQAGELAGRSRFAMRNVLVMGQLALTVVTLTAAGLFVKSAVAAASATPGFTFDRGILIQTDASMAGYDAARTRAVYAQVLDRLRARPDVASASVATLMPFDGFSEGKSVQKAGAPLKTGDAGLVDTEMTRIGADYFRTLDLAMTRGREFTDVEEMAASRARNAIVDEPLARKLFGDSDAIGREVQYADVEGAPPVTLTIVGVAPGLKVNLFDPGPMPHLYLPYGADARSSVYFHVRTRSGASAAETAMLPSLRDDVRAIDSRLPILALETRATYRERDLLLAVVRTGARIFSAFGLAALFLAVVGVYGVKSYLVSRRTREIGIRLALGATPRNVIWLVAREGLVLSTVGLAIGAVLAAGTSVAMRSMSYDAHGLDVGLIAGAFGVLAASALAAGWLPARRATRIAPIRALRE